MERRMILAAMILLVSSSAMADEQITIRPGFRDRLIIEDATGRNLGTVRETYDGNLLIETPEGRDIGTIRGGRVDIDACDDERKPLSCLFGGEDDE